MRVSTRTGRTAVAKPCRLIRGSGFEGACAREFRIVGRTAVIGNRRFSRRSLSGDVLRGVFGREAGKTLILAACGLRRPRVRPFVRLWGSMWASFGIKVLCQGDRDTGLARLRSVSCGRPRGLGGVPRRKACLGKLDLSQERKRIAGPTGLLRRRARRHRLANSRGRMRPRLRAGD